MKTVFFDQTLQYLSGYPKPNIPNEAIIKTRLAGICNTDVEIMRGYMGFRGVLGHEFVGEVVQADSAPAWVGKRVVGEINAFCSACETCRRGHLTQCPHRTTLGIGGRDGCMAEYFSLPTKLLYEVPENVPDEWAVFAEPLAAACQILEQVHLRPTTRVAVLGDGKLGLLIAQVLQLTGCDLRMIGKHPGKLAILERRGIKTWLVEQVPSEQFDVVVEVTGSPRGFAMARQLVRPRGTLVLKSTFNDTVDLNLSMLVVDEINLIGSRCGPFAPALRLMSQRLVDLDPLIHARYPIDEALAAFDKATQPGVLKVLLEFVG